ncbi:MAG: YkgJ family cysteine cluster protein [Lysobacter sp.]|nr:MAG: YkgJ family cysteine cluster protein [Lysobacter sp.]
MPATAPVSDLYDLEDVIPDPDIQCSRCDAVCCRLTVVVMPEDAIPGHLVETTPEGLRVMARDEDGWCVAIDSARMCCSIYETRPAICRKFSMGGPYCAAVREDHANYYARPIPVALV